MKRVISLALAALVLAILPGSPLRTAPASATTVCGSAKKCITLTATVGRVWSEGSDSLHVTRYDVKVDASGLPAGTQLVWFEHMSDNTFSGGYVLAQAGSGGRAQGTVSPICPSWYVGAYPLGGKVSAFLPSGEIYERWTAPRC